MIFEKLAMLISEQFGVSVDQITMDTQFVDDLNADSVDKIDLMMAVEEAFELDEIEEDALMDIKTVEDVVKMISERV
ncbi:MAG: acyl carrier protein [Clostridia bacterium]|nr:acyl carrier protein [Clostridia bacterium]MBQ3062859.1 acyl carrier protein [Clostridia bacterium]MBQ9966982.1 acyl carrier protein [Clostridia bacterium]